MNSLEPWTWPWFRDYLSWVWAGTTNERLKTLAAFVQASGFLVAAILTYRYGRKLEHHKFDMRLKEITHANTHKRRMESMERISGYLGKVVANLAKVPPFFDYFDLDPLPPQVMVGVTTENREERRSRYRLGQYHQSILDLREATEEGCIYVNESNYELIQKFITDTENLLRKFDEEFESNPPFSATQALGHFHEGYKKILESRRNIMSEFKKQLEK